MKSYEEVRRGNLQGNAGYLGFLGFLGCSYFGTFAPPYLLLFSLFGLFGGFFIDRMLTQKHDERYTQNSAKARSAALFTALGAIGLLAVLVSLGCVVPEILLCVCAFGIAAVMIVYGAAMWYYERH